MGGKKTRLELARIRKLLGGGMARLTLGVQREDGTQYVIRELLPRNLFRVRLHRAFVNGTAIRAKLSPHPHIVASVERGYSGLRPYEVIEYVEGSNLKKLIQTQHEDVRGQAFEILRQAARALAHVHENGIVHLDVKAENLLVSGTGTDIQVKLTDFDLSREATATRVWVRAGTEMYMAPEQLMHGQIGPGADIFAFGVMAYNLVTGRMPFDGFTTAETRRRHLSLSADIVDPGKLYAGLEPKLGWTIMRCLEKDPTKRFPNMSYLCQELSQM